MRDTALIISQPIRDLCLIVVNVRKLSNLLSTAYFISVVFQMQDISSAMSSQFIDVGIFRQRVVRGVFPSLFAPVLMRVHYYKIPRII